MDSRVADADGPLVCPDATSTGPTTPSSLTVHAGMYAITSPGTYALGLEIHGGLYITASNVTVSNFRIIGGYVTFSDGQNNYTLTGITLSDFEADGQRTGDPGISFISGNNITILRANIHGYGRALGMNQNDVIQDSYVWDLVEGFSRQAGGESHNECVLTNGGSNLTIRHNRLENALTQTAAVSLFGDNAPGVQHVIVDGNCLSGGGYTLYGGHDSSKAFGLDDQDIVVTNNRFGRTFFPNSGMYGPVVDFDVSRPGNMWSDNVWDDTGEPVAPN
jgi:hypothetical protein